MTNITLVQRGQGPNVQTVTFHDKALQVGNITIDQDSYTSTLDRVYEVKGLVSMHIEITNQGATNGLTYKIEKCRKEFLDVNTLVDADFNLDILANL